MPRTWDNADAICPFFQTSGIKMVTCEGVTADNMVCVLFQDTKKRLAWRRTFCDRDYKKCEIYKMVMKKYGEE